jgi:uncharacterized protein (DUF362 family)
MSSIRPEKQRDMESAGTNDTMDRRSFLRTGSLGLAGAGLAAAAGTMSARAEDTPKSRLVCVKHDSATDEEGWGHPEIARAMVDRSMLELTGKESQAEAWGQFFSPDDVVGIKANLRGGPLLATQPCVMDAIVAGLVAVGVKENNIIVYEAWTREFPASGYTINTSDKGVRYFATDGLETPAKSEAEGEERRKAMHSSTPTRVVDKDVYFAKVLDDVTALINVPLIKDHLIAGVTCAMKNHFGSIINPRDLHGDLCAPYIGGLYATPAIRDKERLVVVDGLRGIYNGGPHDKPKWRWQPNCIVAGTDPVAIDTFALRVVEDKRKAEGMESVAWRTKYLQAAADLGLGTNDLTKVDLREIDMTTSA